MIIFNEAEKEILDRFKTIKQQSGSHSPSVHTLTDTFPDIRIDIDACFLSNPYATDLFMQHLEQEVIETGNLRETLEYYPTQSPILATEFGTFLGLHPKKMFLGNGASEIIQAIIHRFTKKKLLLCIPTFSPYYEFPFKGVEVIFHQLQKENDFCIDTEALLKDVEEHQPDTVILINPNNPTGGYLTQDSVAQLLEPLKCVENLILDESFIHFTAEDDSYQLISNQHLVDEYPNLIVIKSMSKDFGIAGIRAGYAVMAENKVESLIKNGFLWNLSGLAEYFFRLYMREDFQKSYEPARIRYIKEREEFFTSLQLISSLHAYPSDANFFLIELIDGSQADDLVLKLLISEGIYARSCKDKIGLSGEFIRVASRRREENQKIISALNTCMS